MKILVVGGGGREHALCWKIARSPLVEKVWCAPGNGGIAKVAECVPIGVEDFARLEAFCREQRVDLVVVGPEAPLCLGLTDALQAAGIKVFGPSRLAAEIEGSKAFCRELCRRHHIPSPQSWTFSDLATALAFLEGHRDERLVVKASGLAAGKGVLVCDDYDSARKAVASCLESGAFGAAGSQIVIEEFLEGDEVSMLALCDGRTIVPLESAKDHKRSLEGDKGPNTGGMGAISPAPAANPRTIKHVESQVLVQAIHAMVQEGRPYRGILYAGLMVTPLGPRVLEFNARFGDPEAQPLLMRFESDLVPFLVAAADGSLDKLESGPTWDARPAACVVAVSGGYPEAYSTGFEIHGLDDVEEDDDLVVFHSGTTRKPDGTILTAGGRVLSVTAKAKTVRAALDRCYAALDKISFQGMRYRRDIGQR
ncbi:MAG: phosphoribosylamine--glycine ligase [Planctomycetes bacterium]|nr:phosphoribosylamine--glycine ligase [Planctomycetota bacterium]